MIGSLLFSSRNKRVRREERSTSSHEVTILFCCQVSYILKKAIIYRGRTKQNSILGSSVEKTMSLFLLFAFDVINSSFSFLVLPRFSRNSRIFFLSRVDFSLSLSAPFFASVLFFFLD